MRGIRKIGIRNWLLLTTFIFSNIFLLYFWPNRGFGWISFVLCAYIIGTVNFLTFIINFKKYDSVIIGFLLFRCFWSLSFTIYMLLVEFNLFPSLGLSIILLFFGLASLDVLIILSVPYIVQELGIGFIPKNSIK